MVIKWFNQKNEPHTRQAQKIFHNLQSGKINVLIPNLLLVELLNVLMVGKKIPTEEANLAIKRLFASSINIMELTLSVLQQTSVVMEQYDLTSYDAYFLL